MFESILEYVKILRGNGLYQILKRAYLTENDKYYRDKAGEAYDKLHDYLQKNESTLDLFMQKAKGGWVLRGGLVDKEFKEILFYFIPSDSKYYAGIGKFNGKTLIRLPCLLSVDDLRYLANRLSRKTFVHEYIHYLDELRSNKSSKSSDKVNDLEAYYNDPREFNAFFQEGADDLIKFVKAILREHPGNIEMYEELFPKNMNEFREKYLSMYFSERFIAHLNPIYKKKFQKRFVMLYQEVQDMLYPKGKKLNRFDD